MPKLDNIKEKIALFKWMIGMMIAIVIAIAGWVLNKFQINENVLISIALAVMVLLSIISILLFRKIIALIDEVAKIKKIRKKMFGYFALSIILLSFAIIGFGFYSGIKKLEASKGTEF